jgi:hypothetical protein
MCGIVWEAFVSGFMDVLMGGAHDVFKEKF